MMKPRPWILAALFALAPAAATANPYMFYYYGPEAFSVPAPTSTPYMFHYFGPQAFTASPATPPAFYWFQTMPPPSAFLGGRSFNITTNELTDGYVVNLYLQDIDPSEIEMKVSGNMLVFERTAAGGGSGMGGFSFGGSTFHWSVPLPADADLSRINGRVQPEGIQLFIPKKW